MSHSHRMEMTNSQLVNRLEWGLQWLMLILQECRKKTLFNKLNPRLQPHQEMMNSLLVNQQDLVLQWLMPIHLECLKKTL